MLTVRIAIFAVAVVLLAIVIQTIRTGAAENPRTQQTQQVAALDHAEQVAPMLKQGAEFMLTRQTDDGAWGRHPALTGLAIMAIHNVDVADIAKRDKAIARAMDYMLSFIQDDGAIFPAERSRKESANYPNYTTAIALITIALVNRPGDEAKMRAARRYLQASQFNDPDKVDFGGIGYGKTGRADLSNGSWAAEALYVTDYLDREPFSGDTSAAARIDKMWQDMTVFLTQCQNLPELNIQPYVSLQASDRGGFIYRPFESKAGDHSATDGAKSELISSGSMTYAGLKTMIYARLDRNDIRVKGAIDYLRHNYTLKENPGMGQQGRYYYLHTMAKALDTYGIDVLADADGVRHHWRNDIIAELRSLQHDDGSWANTDGRFWESVPELATPYAMICLKVSAGQLKFARAPRG